MARPSAGIRIAVVCTVLSASLLAAGPAQAGVGDLVDGAVDGAGAGVVRDTVRDEVERTVDQVTGSSDAVLGDTVGKVTEPDKPSPPERSSGARRDETDRSRVAAEPQRDTPQAVGSRPRNDLAAPAARTSSDGSNAPPQRHKAHRGQPAMEPASAVTRIRSTPAHGDHPCASASLAARDLRRCARAGASTPEREGTSLPGLGGAPMTLLPAGLLMVGLGLVLVACGRRRGTSVAPAA